MREFIGERIPAVGDPRKSIAPGKLPSREMRPDRRKCGENRNAGTWVRPNVSGGSPGSPVGPIHPNLAREEESPHGPFKLPTEGIPGTRNKRVRHVLRVQVAAASLARSSENAAGVAKPREVLREAKGAVSANRIFGRIMVGKYNY
jgi:hypothetical protein